MNTTRYIAIFLSALFLGTVSIERLPGVLVPTDVPHEWLMFGLFKISLLDDITHGVSGLMGVGALLLGFRWTVKYLMLIGGYYSLDAIFYLLNGVAVGMPVVDNLLLNVPHIGISVLVFIALRRSVRGIELRADGG